jgi:hypothetical protein
MECWRMGLFQIGPSTAQLGVRVGRPFGASNPLRGCNSDLAQYSHTPILPPATLRVAMRAGHHSAWPDSRTRTSTKERTQG